LESTWAGRPVLLRDQDDQEEADRNEKHFRHRILDHLAREVPLEKRVKPFGQRSINTNLSLILLLNFFSLTPMEGITEAMSKLSSEHVEHLQDIETTDVLICGCGPTGAMLSAQLGRLGIMNVVLDREPGITEDPRGIALDEDGIRLLQSLGLYDAIYTEIGSCLCSGSSHRSF
jgi:FAD binding domain